MNAQEAAKTSMEVYRKQHPTPRIDFWHKRINDAVNIGRRCQYFRVDVSELKNEGLTIHQLLKAFKYEGYKVKCSRTSKTEREITISW